MKYTGETEGQYGSWEDPKKLTVIWELSGKYSRVGHPSSMPDEVERIWQKVVMA
jgi:hypothetical protein